MPLYTFVPLALFQVIESTLIKFTLNYYARWKVTSLSPQDDVLSDKVV